MDDRETLNNMKHDGNPCVVRSFVRFRMLQTNVHRICRGHSSCLFLALRQISCTMDQRTELRPWVTRQQLYNVIGGKNSVTPEMAVPFEKAIGGRADMWLRT